MKKKEAEKEAPRTRGRPTGPANTAPAGALNLSIAEIIAALKQTAPAGKDAPTAAALIKNPKYQGGTDGKANSGRIYTPAAWTDEPVLLIKLSADQHAELIRREAEAKAAAIKKAGRGEK